MEMGGQLDNPAALPPVPVRYEAEWALEQVWRTWRKGRTCKPFMDTISSQSSVAVLQMIPILYSGEVKGEEFSFNENGKPLFSGGTRVQSRLRYFVLFLIR
jgi:hypothetical protein